MFQCIVNNKLGSGPTGFAGSSNTSGAANGIHPNDFNFSSIGFSRQDIKDVYPDIRNQLLEQAKSLDNRLEVQLGLNSELSEYFRKKSEIEYEHCKNLEKLSKSLKQKQTDFCNKFLKENAYVQSLTLFHIWNQFLHDTTQEFQIHYYNYEKFSFIQQQILLLNEDIVQIFKMCKSNLQQESHEELLRVLHELYTSKKTFLSYSQEYKSVETKLSQLENQKIKLEMNMSQEKILKSKKCKLVDKEIGKKREKFNESRYKYLRSKNEYLLCIDAANAAIRKYFLEDVTDAIDCMDLGYYGTLKLILENYVVCRTRLKNTIQEEIQNIKNGLLKFDPKVDKQRFLESNNIIFSLPTKFQFETDAENNLELYGFIHNELEQRMNALYSRLNVLKIESNEIWKTCETVEINLNHILQEFNALFFQNDTQVFNSMREKKIDAHLFHVQKFKDYMLSMNRIARLQAKYDHIHSVLKDSGKPDDKNVSSSKSLSSSNTSTLQVRKRIGRLGSLTSADQLHPKLFGGSLEEYLEITKQDIPLIVYSCVRVINLYGLHHQGIFRVSGSQVEINNFKDSFERGEDPLANMTDASDINSVAGVLKLYLRELREPLFPIVFFELFIHIASQDNSVESFILQMSDVVRTLPRPVFVVLRFLFGFLNHLSEYSDENMMDPYNLAVCFGPTLFPVPDDKEQVHYQNLVNELIKNIIINYEEIFPNDGGPVYEKYKISLSQKMNDTDEVAVENQIIDDSSIDSVPDDDPCNSAHSSDGEQVVEALYDFQARSHKEISFKKGDKIRLIIKVSFDWWKGYTMKGGRSNVGYVPHKFLLFQQEEKKMVKSPDDLNLMEKYMGKETEEQVIHITCKPEPILQETSIISEEDEEEVANGSASAAIDTNLECAQESKMMLPPVLSEQSQLHPSIESSLDEEPEPDNLNGMVMTPDLVLDLPLNNEEERTSSGHSSPSPSNSNQSLAEVFAKQNQSTMKKKSVPSSSNGDTKSEEKPGSSKMLINFFEAQSKD